MAKTNDNTFVKITNSDVYSKLLDLEHSLQTFAERNTMDHTAICKRQDYTNGKVRLSKWISTTALSICLIALGFLFNHLSG